MLEQNNRLSRKYIWIVLSILFVISVIFLVIGYYQTKPNVRVRNGLQYALQARQMQTSYEFVADALDDQGDAVHFGWSDGQFIRDGDRSQTFGSGTFLLEHNDLLETVPVQYAYAQDKSYIQWGTTGWIQLSSFDMLMSYLQAVADVAVSVDWSESDSDIQGLFRYQASLPQSLLQQLTSVGFPSAYGTYFDGTGILIVDLDSKGRLVQLSLTGATNESGDMHSDRNCMTALDMTVQVQAYNMLFSNSLHLPDYVKTSQDSCCNLDVILAFYGVSLPDRIDWNVMPNQIRDDLVFLQNDWCKVSLDTSLLPYVELEDDVLWAYPSKTLKKGNLSARISFGDAFCTEDLVAANRRAADTYFAEQKEAEAVKEVNLGDIQMTSHGNYWVFWYVEQYTNCTVQADGDTVIRTYHFYVKRPEGDGFIRMDVQGCFDIAASISFGDATGLRLLDALIVEPID